MKKVLRFAGKFLLYFLLLSVASVIVFRFVPIPFTPLMAQRMAGQLINHKPIRFSKDWVSIEKMTPLLPLAVVASEDQNYLEHSGFDTKAIEEAMKYNEHHKKKRGASTISQQTAKNVFLWPSRSWLRKGFEVYFTFLIEVFWNKERIMEVYLNVIEMGDGIYGAEAAAHYYFHKSAAELNGQQCAALASILPSPLKWSPIRPGAMVAQRQRWILRQMSNLGGTLDFDGEGEK